MTGQLIVYNMTTYELTINLSNTYDITKTITAPNIHTAITNCRVEVKKEYDTEKMWIVNVREI